MKEVKKCSISGISFTMDADAYERLTAYIDTLKEGYKDSPDCDEITADIETRIAELILSTQDNTRVVQLPLIENIIQQLGTLDDISSESPDDTTPHRRAPRIPRRLYRDMGNSKLGGVCAGLGKYFDADPTWIRLGLFLPLIVGVILQCIPGCRLIADILWQIFGLVILGYIIMWFAVPVARSPRQHLEMDGEKITAKSLGERINDIAADDKPQTVLARIFTILGQIALIFIKFFVACMALALIVACAGIIVGIVSVMTATEISWYGWDIGWWGYFNNDALLSILALTVAFIPCITLAYTFIALIFGKKPNNKILIAAFILWCISLVSVPVTALFDGWGIKDRYVEYSTDTDSDSAADGEILTITSSDNDEQVRITRDENGITICVKDGDERNEVRIDSVAVINTNVADGAEKVYRKKEGAQREILSVEDNEGNKVRIRVGGCGLEITSQSDGAEQALMTIDGKQFVVKSPKTTVRASKVVEYESRDGESIDR